MWNQRTVTMLALPLGAMLLHGCAAPKVDFAALSRPARAAELEAFDVFVGSWSWNAKVAGDEDPGDTWTGTATWAWTLDKRCLHGQMSARGAHTEFETAGVWSWNPKTRKYIWWMFNDWGYPQQGTAAYDADNKSWTMKYRSIGLDGTTSHGRYVIRIVDQNKLDWKMVEWADALHMVKKLEMSGTYVRTD